VIGPGDIYLLKVVKTIFALEPVFENIGPIGN